LLWAVFGWPHEPHTVQGRKSEHRREEDAQPATDANSGFCLFALARKTLISGKV